MAKITKVLQTPTFKKAVKKLDENQKKDVDKAVQVLREDPLVGEPKKGALSFLRVYTFNIKSQRTLLGYSYQDGTVTLEVMALGAHEDVYQERKSSYWAEYS